MSIVATFSDSNWQSVCARMDERAQAKALLVPLA